MTGHEPDYVFEQFLVAQGRIGYLVADPETGLATVVDPQVEIVEVMLEIIFERGLRPTYIIDTHTHADHFSGAGKVRRKTVAKIVMHKEAPASNVDIRVEDGDRLWLGELPLKFLHTPGHAKDLVSVMLPDRVLTADALLIGSCGRTDLPNSNATRQYHTLYYTFNSLPDELLAYPGHDYEDRSYSTLGEEKKNNPKMAFASEKEFVEFMDRENPENLTPVHKLADALKANMA